MQRFLIVSNRLPVSIEIDNAKINIKASVGGLATGLRPIHEKHDSRWIGWPGINPEDYPEEVQVKINQELEKNNYIPVNIDSEVFDDFYFGFSNKTIWPIFHYFMQYTEYHEQHWEAYKRVNEQFAEVISQHIREDDILWIHDYQLLLLPRLIRKRFPKLTIGFFLHIPFPSYEVFRLLPWRREIIEGMLGADLLGFHTYDYQRHFNSCVRRILGYETSFNQIKLNKRNVVTDNFPLGIDFEWFQQQAKGNLSKSGKDKTEIQKEIDKYFLMAPERKLIVSIDRLDYTKGIANRLEAFEHFLDSYPEYIGKVTLVMVATPTRDSVEYYQLLKKEVDELVGKINGKYASINWTPIWYFYRSLPIESVIELYAASEVALITPVRDGMNLVAKEYIASKTDQKGVLILSEMAGAAKEMNEALIINPNNKRELSEAIKIALEMPEEEQVQRNQLLQNRLKRYNVHKWANDFISGLEAARNNRKVSFGIDFSEEVRENIFSTYRKSEKALFFLDYDGTLTGFKDDPEKAMPDQQLYDLLDQIANRENSELVIISGRDRDAFDRWFSNKKFHLITEHGVWLKKVSGEWEFLIQLNNDWKEKIVHTLEYYVDRTPGSFIEEKNYSLVWHYRKTDPELGQMRAIELKDELSSLTSNNNLEIMEGNKVIEIKTRGVNKGQAALQFMMGRNYDFLMAIGDDWTDEYLFEILPSETISIKVGMGKTKARYHLADYQEVRSFLAQLAEQ
ncbi:MAG: bifunctional alpha,alpha-trehalose-phosphate synthase (UDP-forming)/trehalose-phosphatase [Prolixibacteraceae bacterium]|jgi:trehalose 6-phosphate synthase/phosphatase|nr:bifunctional alpha,alpha-trehalose-phosphate synthase (UDP-forming)/trehalose-phosphatase [Prolixibacteraceae bacterium]